MTRLVFETAALADAVKKADQIAPGSAGQAFDKAAGILIEASPSTGTVIIKATNLDVYSMEWLSVAEAEGPDVMWRLPSKLFTQVITSLPIGTGRQVTLEDKQHGYQSQVHITTGKMRAKFNMMDSSYYPRWSAFDPSLLTPVADFGGRMAQVDWAAAKSGPPLSGVNFDGEFIQATDQYRLARAPLKVEGLSGPVTIPAKILTPLLRQTGEISIGFSGEQLLIMPDEHSQYRTVIYGLDYPAIGKLLDRELSTSLKVKKAELLDILQRAAGFASSDRDQSIRCFIGKNQFAVMADNPDTGSLGDIIDIPGQADHPRIEVRFSPKNFIEPIEKAPSDEVIIHYDTLKESTPFKIDGGSGYTALAMPRRKDAQ